MNLNIFTSAATVSRNSKDLALKGCTLELSVSISDFDFGDAQ
jgi:hypothetical protein